MRKQKKKLTSLTPTEKRIAASGDLYAQIRTVILKARAQAYRSVNVVMVEAYWNVGRLIVEKEQGGKKRAAYGEAVLADLSVRLTTEFGQGFDLTNLRKMRQFYLTFPKQDALRPELSWTHYRLLLRIDQRAGARASPD